MEEETLQLLEALELGDVRWAYDVIEAHILEGDLLDRLLEIEVVEDLKRVAVDEKFVVAFDLGVTRLHEALRAGLLPPFVAVEPETFDSLHFVLPFLADHLQQAFWTDVFLLVVVLVVLVRVGSRAALWGSIIRRLRARCGGIHVGIII